MNCSCIRRRRKHTVIRSLQRRRDSVLRSFLTFCCKDFTLSLSNEASDEIFHFYLFIAFKDGLRKLVYLYLIIHLFFAVLLVKLFDKNGFQRQEVDPMCDSHSCCSGKVKKCKGKAALLCLYRRMDNEIACSVSSQWFKVTTTTTNSKQQPI